MLRWLLVTCTLVISSGLLAGVPARASAQEVANGYLDGYVETGYRNVWLTQDKSRVLEYAGVGNSATGEVLIDAGLEQKRFHLLGSYLNDQEYHGELDLDIHGLVRVELETDRLVHNLEHIPYAGRPAPPDDIPAGQNGYLTYADQNPGDRYQVEIRQHAASTRLKHPNYPAHLNLSYWRLERLGDQQLRFVDEGHGNIPGATDGMACRKCHMQAKSNQVDRITDEFSAGIDAHVGPVDIIVEHLYREFRDQNDIQSDLFGTHSNRDIANGPTVRQHDEAPDSSLNKTSVKLHTSLAGGLVGAASASFGRMKDQSRLSEVQPVESATDFYQLAGDATYIINPQWTLNFRYRMADLKNDTPDFVIAAGTLPGNEGGTGRLPVRNSVDVTRSSYEAAINYRPARACTLRGEYRYLDIERGNTSGPVDFTVAGGMITQPDLSWELPDQETVQRFKLSLQARPLASRKLQIKAHYSYEAATDAAYGTSYEHRHELFGGATWAVGSRWGLHGSARYNNEENDGHELFLPDGFGGFMPFNPTRTRDVTNLVAGAWLMPVRSVTINANYGYLNSTIHQDLIFGGQPSEIGPDDPLNYSIFDSQVPYDQTVQTATVMIDWRVVKEFGCTLEGRIIKSKSHFDPDFPVTPLAFGANMIDQSSDELREISEVSITQTGLTFGIDWTPAPAWTCTTSYSYDDYDDQRNAIFEGTAQMVMASLAYRW
jgi:hypothetical protein